MKATKLITALAAVTLMIGTTGMASAKKGGSNHGKNVSAVARSKDSSGRNHGQTVSAAARSKNKSYKNKSYSRDDDRWERDDDWREGRTRTNRQRTDYRRTDWRRTNNTTRQTRINTAVRERNAAIRAAQLRYAERRRAILNDGSRNNRLTNRQSEQLRLAQRDRDRAIRNAQEKYRQTVRRIG